MKLTLRSYQTECVESIWSYFRKHSGNPVCALPTGTGKSVIIAAFAESVLKPYPNQKILVMTHVKELIKQNHDKFVELWPQAPSGIYSSGLNKRDTMQKVIFCGVASVAKRAHEFGIVNLVIVDECHLVSPTEKTMYQKFFGALKEANPDLKIIGFTATPWRLGHGKLTDDGGIFTDTCFDITTVIAFNRLIAEGYLCPLIPKKTALTLDTSGVHMQGGEFIASELQRAVDKQEITRQALLEAIEYKDTRKHWLIFSSGVDHATHIATMLNSMGVTAAAVHSKMPTADRDKNIADFKAGKIQAIVNNNILTTGFDYPEIDMIVCLRPTASSVLWVQMLGRGTRPAPWAQKENCLVLDFAANAKRLGPINDPVIPRKAGKGGGDAPVKICPKCDCYVHASVRWCTGITKDEVRCDHEFSFETKLNQGASSEELIKGDLPVVEVFKIDHINYTFYQKQDRPGAMKVSYYCGYRMFEEYVCVEYSDYPGRRARGWLNERLPLGSVLPTTAVQALAMAEFLKAPTHLRIWTNKKYPQIMAYCFDGSSFGNEPEKTSAPPSVEVYKKEQPIPASTAIDDDIPF